MTIQAQVSVQAQVSKLFSPLTGRAVRNHFENYHASLASLRDTSFAAPTLGGTRDGAAKATQSVAREGHPERGHLLAVAHQQGVAD